MRPSSGMPAGGDAAGAGSGGTPAAGEERRIARVPRRTRHPFRVGRYRGEQHRRRTRRDAQGIDTVVVVLTGIGIVAQLVAIDDIGVLAGGRCGLQPCVGQMLAASAPPSPPKRIRRRF